MVNLIRDFIKRNPTEVNPSESRGEPAFPPAQEASTGPRLIIQEKVDTVRFNIHKEPHITLDTEQCKTCDTTACVYVCPANLFNIVNGEMLFVYDNCFECGTCYVACGKQAIKWSYPQGGYGVAFRQS